MELPHAKEVLSHLAAHARVLARNGGRQLVDHVVAPLSGCDFLADVLAELSVNWRSIIWPMRLRRALHSAPAISDRPQLGDALTGVVDAVIARMLSHPRMLEVVLGQVRAIVREELARAPFAERLLDAAEAAERLGMTEAALRKAVVRGTIPCLRKGRRIRFRLSDLMA